MKITYILLLSLVCFQDSSAKILRIAGGKATTIEDIPYQAILVKYDMTKEDKNETFLCGATIISYEWLVTAAHCLNSVTAADLEVRTGVTKINNGGEGHKIQRFIKHPGFRIYEYAIANDIGLIQLTEPMKFDKVQNSIPLAMPTDEPTVGKILTISGYGRENEHQVNEHLQLKAVSLPIISIDDCKIDYVDPITDKMICAGNSTDSPCIGDTGGPGVMDGKLAAIVSTHFFCDTTHTPAIFTAVHKYLDWIAYYVKN